MTAQDIRRAYLDFFKDNGHQVIPRAKLIPEGDPTTLFTGSGMQPLLPYLLGEEHPAGVRLVDSQTCLRAQDIEDVGDNRHTTFFEMLGNWSLGDYFKEQQIRWFFSFLTDKVGLDPEKIYVSCFIGDEKYGIKRDTESAEIWQKLFAEKGIDAKIVAIGSQADGNEKGMQDGRIFFYDDGENWWSRGGGLEKTPMGDPCGPDSEVFYDFEASLHIENMKNKDGEVVTGQFCHPACECGKFMEIGNQVFMQYQRTEDGFKPLAKKNVDFGGGLERIAAARLDSPDVFRISLLWPIVEKLETLSGKKYESHTESMRVIADHLRAATFLAVDGVVPSNKEQGYVMRRLMRRAIRFAFELGVEQGLCEQIVPVIADIYANDYPEVAENRQQIIDVLIKEEKSFRNTLRKGLKEIEKISQTQKVVIEEKGKFYEELSPASPIIPGQRMEPVASIYEKPLLTGADIFKLQDTYGFPSELTIEEAFKMGIARTEDWRKKFDELLLFQRMQSQTAAKGVFKGGLGGQSDIHKKYHTATHLMYQALRTVLGDHVIQHGSNITEERLRFDFSHPEKVTSEQIKQVEDIVNEQIQKDLPVFWKEYPTKDALDMGALGAFGDRYGEVVKIYQMGEGDDRFSFEICGGPHVDHTGQLAEGGKKFKIQKEESSSSGIRRIKAVLA